MFRQIQRFGRFDNAEPRCAVAALVLAIFSFAHTHFINSAGTL